MIVPPGGDALPAHAHTPFAEERRARSVVLRRRPHGSVQPSDFEVVAAPLCSPADGEVLVEITHISLDPAMRGWMNEGRSYIEPIAIGEVLRAIAVGKVIEGRSNDLARGEYVTGLMGVQSHWTGNAGEVRRIDIGLAPPEKYLHPLGMTGQTAYFGLTEIGKLKPGETVVVSAASGAVGSLVGQIAKVHGCQVIGIAGGPEKCSRVVNDFGFDACIDYRNEPVARRMRELTDGRIDIFFDNVGGEVLEAAMANLNRSARVVICGAISGYNDMSALQAPRNYINLLIQSARMEGFVVFDYFARHAEATAAMARWLQTGAIVSVEQIETGLENFTAAFDQLFTGANHGKLILRP